jgi:hypothetical protein
MKKILLGATALTLVGMAGAASAQNVTTSPFNLDIGGFATLGVGYVDSKASDNGRPADANGNGATDGQPVTITNNAEVHLNFELVADNGLTFGYKAEMELNDSAQNVDEYVGSVSGSFGRIEIGVEDGAHDRFGGYLNSYVFTHSGDGTGMLFDLQSDGVAAVDTDGRETNDGFKLSYFTPTIAGFAAGISYAASGDEGATASDVTDDSGSGFEFGARYRNTFGAFSVSLGGGYTILTDDSDDDQGATAGINLGFGNFEWGLNYGVDINDGTDNQGIGTGITYTTGPWLAQVNFAYQLEHSNSAEDDTWGAGGEVVYSLAPGVRTGLAVEYASDTFDVNNAGRTDFASDSDAGFAAGLFLGLTF